MTRRVFKGHPYAPTDIYEVTHQGDIDEGELIVFLKEAKAKLPAQIYGMLERLAKLSPARRLAVNLKTLIGLMGEKEVTDVFRFGITPQERAALAALQVGRFSPRIKEIGHSLLGIQERAQLINALGSKFKVLVTKAGGFVNECDLD